MALPVGRLIVGFRNNIRQGCDRRHDTYDPSRKRHALRVRLLHQICRFGVKAKSLTIVCEEWKDNELRSPDYASTVFAQALGPKSSALVDGVHTSGLPIPKRRRFSFHKRRPFSSQSIHWSSRSIHCCARATRIATAGGQGGSKFW